MPFIRSGAWGMAASCHLLKRTKKCCRLALRLSPRTSMSLFLHQDSVPCTLGSASAALVCSSGSVIKIWIPEGFESLVVPFLGHSVWNKLFVALAGHRSTKRRPSESIPDILFSTPVWQQPWKVMMATETILPALLFLYWPPCTKVIRWQSHLSVQWNLTETFSPWELELPAGRQYNCGLGSRNSTTGSQCGADRS